MDQVLPIATHVPYMTSPGNHERDYLHSGAIFHHKDSGGECGVAYQNRYIMPSPSGSNLLHTKIPNYAFKPGPNSIYRHDTPWYSFRYGNIHVVMLSTE